jgi:hypothetical protein
MKNRKPGSVPAAVAVLSVLVIPLSLQAAEPAHPCAGLYDDAQRLGCYDGAFGRPVRPIAAAPATATTATAANTSTAVTAAVATAAVVTAAPAPAPSPAPKASKPAPESQPDTYKSSVKEVSRTADGRFMAKLENGEEWLQLERDSAVDVKVGETVTLKKMLFGNYSLVTRTGYTVRVKRLE